MAHRHEFRFAPNIEEVSDAKVNTYGFYCVASTECKRYLLLPEAESRLNALEGLGITDSLMSVYADRLERDAC